MQEREEQLEMLTRELREGAQACEDGEQVFESLTRVRDELKQRLMLDSREAQKL